MKKLLISSITLLVLLTGTFVPVNSLFCQEDKLPVVVVLATGGTIAGSAKSAVDASYNPATISIDQIIESVPEAAKIATLQGIQVCNIASQNIELSLWLQLCSIIDSLFVNDVCDGVVITHGTDTMEETAFFLNLTVRHKSRVVLTGSMRPSTALSADGPSNLYNAIALAASEEATGRGVMVVMNDYIFSADDVTKINTLNTNAFSSPNLGPLGRMRGGKPEFFRENLKRHTFKSEFDVIGKEILPSVEIVYCYAFASPVALRALTDSGVEGIVIAGVGHGNYNREIAREIEYAKKRGVCVVRSSRIVSGGVDTSAEEYDVSTPVAFMNNPQKARILLMLALSKKTGDINREPITGRNPIVGEICRIFSEY